MCLFKCSLCQRDKEFDGFIRNTKALFSRVRRAPLGSSQSADKLGEKKKKKEAMGRGKSKVSFIAFEHGPASREHGAGHIPYPTTATLDGEARCVLVSLLEIRALVKHRSSLGLSHFLFWCPHCPPGCISCIIPFLLLSPVCWMGYLPFHLHPRYSQAFLGNIQAMVQAFGYKGLAILSPSLRLWISTRGLSLAVSWVSSPLPGVPLPGYVSGRHSSKVGNERCLMGSLGTV